MSPGRGSRQASSYFTFFPHKSYLKVRFTFAKVTMAKLSPRLRRMGGGTDVISLKHANVARGRPGCPEICESDTCER